MIATGERCKPVRDLVRKQLSELFLLDYAEDPDDRGIRDILAEAERNCWPLWPALLGTAPMWIVRLSIEQRLFVTFVGMCLASASIAAFFGFLFLLGDKLYFKGSLGLLSMGGLSGVLEAVRDGSSDLQFEFVSGFLFAVFATLAIVSALLGLLVSWEQSCIVGGVDKTMETGK